MNVRTYSKVLMIGIAGNVLATSLNEGALVSREKVTEFKKWMGK
ncbi:MAG: hypothetical protein ABIN95_00570 [Mucilaginibacter sp.]